MKQLLSAREEYARAFHNLRCWDNFREHDVIPLPFIPLSAPVDAIFRRRRIVAAAQRSLDARDSYSENEAPM